MTWTTRESGLCNRSRMQRANPLVHGVILRKLKGIACILYSLLRLYSVYVPLKEHSLHLEHEVLSDKRMETVIKALFILQSAIYCVDWSNINIPLKFVLVTPGYRPHKNIISNKSEPSLNCWVVPELCADNWGHKQHFAASLVK